MMGEQHGSGWAERMDSPLGVITVVATDSGIRAVVLPGAPVDHGAPRSERPAEGRAAELARLGVRQLAEYLAGVRWEFDLPLATEGTAFQRAAWAELARIPAGCTITYGEQARRLGRPGAARAVGGANRANPVPILVPCHRVVAAGSAGGYAGGVHAKEWLLAHERAITRAGRDPAAR